jgi:hypothetical protein
MPVVVTCAAIGIVLPITLGGSSDTTTSPPHSSAAATSPPTSGPPASRPSTDAGGTDLTGTYVGVGHDNSLTMLLELTQSGSSLRGTLVVNGSHYSPTLDNSPGNVSGEVDRTSRTFSGHVPTFGLSFSGQTSGTSLIVSFSTFGDPEHENELGIVFQRGTTSEFSALTHKATPSVTNVQVNLVNAVKAAKVVYQASQSFGGRDHSNEPGTFAQQAPELIWTTKPCTGKPVNCVSMRTFDIASSNDAQGIALAVYNARTATCWYAIDLEASPTVVANDRSAFVATSSDPNKSVTKPGVYYARSPSGSEPSFCIASLVLNAHEAAWGTSFANAGALE